MDEGKTELRRRCEFHLHGPAAGVAITLAGWAWQPQFTIRRSLSGLDCTLFALRAANLLRLQKAAPRHLGLFALPGLGGRCGFELATGTTVVATGEGYAPSRPRDSSARRSAP